MKPALLDTSEAVEALAAEVAAAELVALDTEADSLHAYPERLCLLQVGLPGRQELVDPLSDADLSPLLEALRHRPLVLHGADFDLRLLARSVAVVPSSVFDTMVAARLLGARKFGLSDLVAEHLDEKLDKGLQRANWSRRPLTEAMALYARLDVRHLHELHEVLGAELERLGRISWLEQTCARLVEECSRPREPDPDSAFRIKGSNRLDRRALAVLRELFLWREEEAIAANRPPYFVVSHEVLVNAAERAARKGVSALRLPRNLTRRRGAGLREAAAAGLALPEDRWPAARPRRPSPPPAADKAALGDLKARRDRHAAALGIDPTLIASRAVLQRLAADGAGGGSELLPWQRELLIPSPPD